MPRHAIFSRGGVSKKNWSEALVALPYVLQVSPVEGQYSYGDYFVTCRPLTAYRIEPVDAASESVDAMVCNLIPVKRSDEWMRSILNHCLPDLTPNISPHDEWITSVPFEAWHETPLGFECHLTLKLERLKTPEQHFVATPLTRPEISMITDPVILAALTKSLGIESAGDKKLNSLLLEKVIVGLRAWRNGFAKAYLSHEEVDPTDFYTQMKQALQEGERPEKGTMDCLKEVAPRSSKLSTSWRKQIDKISKVDSWWQHGYGTFMAKFRSATDIRERRVPRLPTRVKPTKFLQCFSGGE